MRDAIPSAARPGEPAPGDTLELGPGRAGRHDQRRRWLITFLVLAAVYVGMTITIAATGSFPGDHRIVDMTARLHEHPDLQHLAGRISDLAIAAVAFGLLIAGCVAVACSGATRLDALVAIAAVLGTLAIKTLTLKLVSRPGFGFQPFPFAFHRQSDEYPSGHATATFALAFAALLVLPPRWQRALAPLAAIAVIVVGVSRVVLGAHYASDVLAGWVLAAALVAGFHAVTLFASPHQP